MAKKYIIIPARYASTRFPGKALSLIGDKTMLEHSYLKSVGCGFDDVLIATEDERISKVAQGFGATVVMTSNSHPTGTDRIAEVVSLINADPDDIIVNLQGDEPMVPTGNICQVADNLALHRDASVASLYEHSRDLAHILDPNCVKVTLDDHGYALYFSRAPIPYSRDTFPQQVPEGFNYKIHVGLYAYRASFLAHYAKLSLSPIESIESLEQLRVLWHGYRIHMAQAQEATVPGVDTVEDLKRVKKLLGYQ